MLVNQETCLNKCLAHIRGVCDPELQSNLRCTARPGLRPSEKSAVARMGIFSILCIDHRICNEQYATYRSALVAAWAEGYRQIRQILM